MTDPNAPAYPNECIPGMIGLTKREAMAMHIAAGVASADIDRMPINIASDAVAITDALLAELARTK